MSDSEAEVFTTGRLTLTLTLTIYKKSQYNTRQDNTRQDSNVNYHPNPKLYPFNPKLRHRCRSYNIIYRVSGQKIKRKRSSRYYKSHVNVIVAAFTQIGIGLSGGYAPSRQHRKRSPLSCGPTCLAPWSPSAEKTCGRWHDP